MKLNVLIPSRGRPYQLAAALYSLAMNASNEHEVTLCVACDDDDIATQECLRALRPKMPLYIRIGPRPDSLGSVANDLSDKWKADAYLIFADDLICSTYGWDAVVAKAVEETPHGVFWWTSASGVPTFVPIITEKWRAACGRLFTEHFPFWYDDLWLMELWVRATESEPIVLDIKVVDKPTATIRMRELRFWHDFFTFMRAERIEEGIRIAEALGLRKPIIGKILSDKLDMHAVVSDNFLEDIMRRNKAESTPPDEAYKRAKERAEMLMLKAA